MNSITIFWDGRVSEAEAIEAVRDCIQAGFDWDHKAGITVSRGAGGDWAVEVEEDEG